MRATGLPAAGLLLAAAIGGWAQVPYERIRSAAGEPGNWLTYSGTYNGLRYSALAGITAENVARLKPVWVYQTSDLNKFETSPLAVDGVMYVSEPPTGAAALDARTGRPLWQYRREMPRDIRPCCGQVNRGRRFWTMGCFWGRSTHTWWRSTCEPARCAGT